MPPLVTHDKFFVETFRRERLAGAFLKARFRAVPPHVEKRVMEIGDLVVLDSLTVTAATCQSLAEFEEALR